MFAYLIVAGAPGAFFFSAWLLMIFAGILSDDIGIEPFGYVTSMVATIGLWLVMAPLAVTAARRTRRRG